MYTPVKFIDVCKDLIRSVLVSLSLYVYICKHTHILAALCTACCGILVPRPGVEPTSPTVKTQNLNFWTTREVSPQNFLISSKYSSLNHRLFRQFLGIWIFSYYPSVFNFYFLWAGNILDFYSFKFLKISFMTQDMVYLGKCFI